MGAPHQSTGHQGRLTQNMKNFDFAIVGYGPTGATMAHLLAHRGWRVAVIDKEVDIYPNPRAITADHEAMRIFQEVSMADEVAVNTVPHPGTDYQGLRGQIIKRFYPLPAVVQPLAWEPTFMFVQPEVEAKLRKGMGRYGDVVQEFLGQEVVDFQQDAKGVELRLKQTATGEEAALHARYLLGCDGGRSTVRKTLDATIEDLAFDEWWIVVDALLLDDVELPERCVQYCRPSRPGSYIVGPDRLRRWEIKIMPGETPQDFEDDAKLRRALASFVDETKLNIIRKAIYRFHALVVDGWRQGRVFLLGDAAHQTPPFMGQGLCAGLRDTVNLAWKLDLVARHGVPEDLLDSYEQERKPHVRTVVAHAKSFGLIIGELDEAKARERDALLEEELDSGRAETIRQKFIPDLEHGLIDLDAQGRPQGLAGRLFVQPWVTRHDQEAQRLDDLVGFDFLVAATSQHMLDDLDSVLWQALRNLGGKAVVISPDAPGPTAPDVFHVTERDGLFADWTGQTKVQAVLVRPDKYVYGSAANAPELNALVARLLQGLRVIEGLPTTA